jgi:hypothetical protein
MLTGGFNDALISVFVVTAAGVLAYELCIRKYFKIKRRKKLC